MASAPSLALPPTPTASLYILFCWPQCHPLSQSPSCLLRAHLCMMQLRYAGNAAVTWLPSLFGCSRLFFYSCLFSYSSPSALSSFLFLRFLFLLFSLSFRILFYFAYFFFPFLLVFRCTRSRTSCGLSPLCLASFRYLYFCATHVTVRLADRAIPALRWPSALVVRRHILPPTK